MRASLRGRVARPAIAVVGVWDPLLPDHRALLARLAWEAHARSLGSLAVLLDPPPRRYLDGPWEWPVYDDVETRVRLMLGCGLDAVCCLRFARADIHAAAADLLALLRDRVPLAELWLGAGQALGTGPAGSERAIAALAAESGVGLVRLPPTSLKPLGRQVRQLLVAGRIAEATRVVGRPPVRRQPTSGRLRLAWRPGQYQAVPLADPVAAVPGPGVEVCLAPTPRGLPCLAWPDCAAGYLAFVAGPGDESGPAAPAPVAAANADRQDGHR